MSDKLTTCGCCGSDACYETHIDDRITTWFCFSCGFQTNTLMTSGSQFLDEQMRSLPMIYKSLAGEDESGKVWIPTYINVEDKGTIFANGNTTDNWGWTAFKHVPVTKEDGDKFKGALYKPDKDTQINFTQDKFQDAIEYIGIV